MNLSALKRLRYLPAALTLLFSLSAPVLTVATADAFSGTGSGTPTDHYVISTCAQLQSIDGGNSSEGVIYELSDNIDCSATASWNGGLGFSPIDNFKGTLDGNDHTISGLHINRPTEDGIGIFRDLNNFSMIIDLKIDATSTFIGRYNVGSFAGYAWYSKLIGVSSSADVSGEQIVGGLVSEVSGWASEAAIRQSEFTGSVSAPSGNAGGITGVANNGWDMSDVLSNGAVEGLIAGGIAGSFANSCGYRNLERAAIYSTVNGSFAQGGVAGQVNNVTCDSANVSDVASFAELTGTGTKGAIYGGMQGSAVTHNDVFFDGAAAGTSACVGTFTASNDPGCTDIGSNVPTSDAPYDAFDFTNIWSNTDPLTLQSFVNEYTSPTKPTSLAVQKGQNGDGIDPTIVQLDWDSPVDQGSTSIRSYRYEVKESTKDWEHTHDGGSSTSTAPFNIYDLRLGVTYNIRVQAYNDYSGSGWQEIEYSPGELPLLEVSDCNDLAAIDDQIGNRFATIELQNDIDCNGVDFVPLGYSVQWDGDDFEGIFDGNGHTISNLTIQQADWGVGLFENADRALFKDVIFTSAQIVGDGEVGVLAGSVDNTNVENVSIVGQVTAAEEYAGGLFGGAYLEDSQEYYFTNVHFSGDVAAPYTTGGLVGDLNVEDPETEFVVSQAVTEGSVSGDYYAHGGLFGYTYVENEEGDGQPDTTFMITDSYSTADVSGEEEVGGFLGYNENYNDGYEVVSETVISNSYFAGSVDSDNQDAGGLVGYVDYLGEEGENLTLSNNFVSGPITANGETYALIGNNSSDGFLDDGTVTLDNNYFDVEATGQVDPMYDNSVIGWTAINDDTEAVDYDPDYFKNNDVNPPLDEWDFNTVWETQTDGFPLLRATIDAGSGGNTGDVNGDGTDDSLQPHVFGLVNGYSGKLQAIELDDGCEVNGDYVSVFKESQFPVQDAGYDYGSSMLHFSASCPGESTTVKLYYYGVSGNFTLRKYNPDTNSFANVPGATFSSTTIDGQQVLVATYELVDNGPLDLDPADGALSDPVGLGAAVVSVPNTGFSF